MVEQKCKTNITRKKKLKKPEPFLTLPLLFHNGILTYLLSVYCIVIERQINPKDFT
jgi:hypothetical protein